MNSKPRKADRISHPKSHGSQKGTLIIIGGQEDKSGEKSILKEVAKSTKNGKLVVATIASQIPDELWDIYRRVFHSLGVKSLEHFTIEQPNEAHDRKMVEIFKDAKTVFFTGGDQLKITTKIGGSEVFKAIYEIYERGGTIAGTSAGAAMMGQTMLVGGENSESHKIGNWMMAPGLGFMNEIMIDQHFAQRGRIGRLLGAVALNPGVLGIGIDEDTSIIVKKNQFEVLGKNAVYVIDGAGVTYTNVAQSAADQTMSMHDVKIHILAEGETFSLENRKPKINSSSKRS
jgi:cyanophycinase